MENLKLPDWFTAPILAAFIAALGYIVKIFLQWIGELKKSIRTHRARLVGLYSLLIAGKAAFQAQSDNRDKLSDLISLNHPEIYKENMGYDKSFSLSFPQMNQDEKELHQIIRTITENTIQPLNQSLLNWLREDTYFKAKTWRKGKWSTLSDKLIQLEAHLLLWNAKYLIWIPNNPAHSLVYLGDEEKHGVAFPTGIEDNIDRLLKRRWVITF